MTIAGCKDIKQFFPRAIRDPDRLRVLPAGLGTASSHSCLEFAAALA
ncbi:MAG: hypothetical protein ACTHJV_00255 [Rhizobiaceae bacterium]